MQHADRVLPDWLKTLVSLGILAAFALPVLRSIADLRPTLETITLWNGTMILIAALCTLTLLAATGAALFVVAQRRLLGNVVTSTMQITTLAFVILVGATIFSLVFRSFGGEEVVTHALDRIPGGVLGAIIAINILIFFLGFFLDFIEIVFIIMPIVAPVILRSDVDPIWFGVLIAMNLQTSFLTPPFGFALFYLKGVAPPGVTTAHIYRGVLPFIAIQLTALVLVFSFPDLATWLPKQIFG